MTSLTLGDHPLEVIDCLKVKSHDQQAFSSSTFLCFQLHVSHVRERAIKNKLK